MTALTAALVDPRTITLAGSLAELIDSSVGTTVTAWFVSFKLTGVVLPVPFADELADMVTTLAGEGGVAIVTAHLIFILGVAVVALHFVGPIARWLEPPKRRRLRARQITASRDDFNHWIAQA